MSRLRPLGPAGRWWDTSSYTRSLHIDTTQQKRMDDVFAANRSQLLNLYTSLKHEQTQLEKVSKTANEAAVDQQIDRVSRARTNLEKATTHTLLEIRKQLTPEQLSQLDALP